VVWAIADQLRTSAPGPQSSPEQPLYGPTSFAELQQQSGDHDDDDKRDTNAIISGNRRQPLPQRFGKGMLIQYIVDDDLERPRLECAEADFKQQKHPEQRHASAV